jgi:hypothetical protein
MWYTKWVLAMEPKVMATGATKKVFNGNRLFVFREPVVHRLQRPMTTCALGEKAPTLSGHQSFSPPRASLKTNNLFLFYGC